MSKQASHQYTALAEEDRQYNIESTSHSSASLRHEWTSLSLRLRHAAVVGLLNLRVSERRPLHDVRYYAPSHNAPKARPNEGSPFQLLVSAEYFDFREAGRDRVVVNVTSKTESVPFKGFVVSAYDGSGKPYGKWDSNPNAHQVPRCKKPAMTHNEASPKREATLVWRPPEGEHSGGGCSSGSTGSGVVQFR
nr:uncharacterized protein LOC113822018 [Penaeus vannamei]